MNCKYGSYGSYGAYGPYGQAGEDSTSDIIGLLVGWTDYFTDTRRRVARYQAQLDDAIRRGASLATIERIQLQLTAAEEELALQVEGEESSREWATLGKMAAFAGILALGSVTFALLARATRG